MTDMPTPPPPPPIPDMSNDTKNLAMLSHLLGIIPVMGFVGPLIIWLTKKQEHPFVAAESREALNFQITVLIGWMIAIAVGWIPCFGWLAWPMLFLANFILCLMGAMKAKEGLSFRYPVNLRLLK
jgi:uncharacterized Tic20 family protein